MAGASSGTGGTAGAAGSTGDIQAVQRVGQLLALFTVNRPRLSVAEAAAMVGMNRSTVSRYFSSLVLAGVLVRSRDEQAVYEPGPLLLQLGAVAQGRRRILDLAPSRMRRLSRETGLTVVLSLLGRAGPVVSAVSEAGTLPILITVRVGAVLDWDSAQGRLFLRFSSDREALARYWDTLDVASRARVEDEVEEAGRLGIVIAPAPMDMSVLAAPVFDDHDLAATVGLVGKPEAEGGSAAALRRAAYLLTQDMGGTDRWAWAVPEGAGDEGGDEDAGPEPTVEGA